jgi:hypothetical protein
MPKGELLRVRRSPERRSALVASLANGPPGQGPVMPSAESCASGARPTLLDPIRRGVRYAQIFIARSLPARTEGGCPTVSETPTLPSAGTLGVGRRAGRSRPGERESPRRSRNGNPARSAVHTVRRPLEHAAQATSRPSNGATDFAAPHSSAGRARGEAIRFCRTFPFADRKRIRTNETRAILDGILFFALFPRCRLFRMRRRAFVFSDRPPHSSRPLPSSAFLPPSASHRLTHSLSDSHLPSSHPTTLRLVPSLPSPALVPRPAALSSPDPHPISQRLLPYPRISRLVLCVRPPCLSCLPTSQLICRPPLPLS